LLGITAWFSTRIFGSQGVQGHWSKYRPLYLAGRISRKLLHTLEIL
jgi:hypothetical protein